MLASDGKLGSVGWTKLFPFFFFLVSAIESLSIYVYSGILLFC